MRNIKVKNLLTIIAITFLMLAIQSKSIAQPSDVIEKRIKAEIQHSFEQLVDASKALDTKKYFSFIDEKKFSGLNAQGKNWNSIDGLRAMIEPGFAAVDKIKSLVFTNVHITVIDANTAILVNEFQQQVLLKNGARFEGVGGGAQVWSKSTGQWKLVSISASNASY